MKYMIKNLMIALVATLSTIIATSTYAQDRPIIRGSLEYNTEYEYWDTWIGTDFYFGDNNQWRITPAIDAYHFRGELELSDIELTIGYTISNKIGLYARFEMNPKTDYENVIIGTWFRF